MRKDNARKFTQRTKGCKRKNLSSDRGSELPGRRKTKEGAAPVLPVAVDAETPSIKAAEIDAIAVRTLRRSPTVAVLEQVDAANLAVDGHCPGEVGSIWDHFELGEEEVLLGPGFVDRIVNRRLLE